LSLARNGRSIRSSSPQTVYEMKCYEFMTYGVFESIYHSIILILNNALGWSTFTGIITCPARQEAVKPLNCSRACREKGNHEVTRLARGDVIAGWALAHQQQREYAYIFVIIHYRSTARPSTSALGSVCGLPPTTPDGLRACTTTISWPHSRVTSRACVPFCRWGLKFPSDSLQRDCSFHRDASVMLHFGDHTSIFVLYKGSNILLFFYPICVFSMSTFSAVHYNSISRQIRSKNLTLLAGRILLPTDGKNLEEILVISVVHALPCSIGCTMLYV